MSLLAGWFLLISFIYVSTAGDSASLLILKESAEDPLQTLQSWNLNSSICSWKGIACSDQGDVVGLQLQFLSFESPSVLVLRIGQLEKLQALDMYMNNISGGFSVSNNKIQRLRLISNSFTHVAIRSCDNLKELEISMNLASERLFEFTNTCPNLKSLNISGNNFSGDFPTHIASFPSLEIVDASFNNFTGAIPGFYSTNLRHLNLSSNRFSAMANNFCVNCSELTSLIVVNNLITEAMQKVLNCARLTMLDLSFNSLTEELPSGICSNVPRLIFLLAWVNNLHGELPVNLAACSNLSIIFLSHNRLVGSIPPKLFQMQKLRWISLASNRLTGTIPTLDINDLQVLQLSSNLLEGPLPERLFVTGVELQNNKLSGTIPSRWENYAEAKAFKGLYLSSLRLVNLQAGLESEETCVGHFSALQGMNLDVGTKLLTSRTDCKNIDLRYLPAFVNSTRSPRSIDVRYNRLEGNIPEGILTMQDLKYLNLAYNLLTGRIPESFGMLKNLNFLNISHNRLTGPAFHS